MEKKDKRNQWTILDKKVLYEHTRFDMVVYDVLNPADTQVDYPALTYKKKSTGVCPVDENGNIYLVGQWRFGAGYYSWEIPEGTSDGDEEPLETIKRELKEEAGITAGEWKYIGKIHPNNVTTDEETHLFIARDLTMGESDPDEYEIITLRRLSFKEAIDEILSGKISDANTVSGILMAYFHLKDELGV
jgi:8-oxo-dGTP pyrophosphatase MutT (NUDIX family)